MIEFVFENEPDHPRTIILPGLPGEYPKKLNIIDPCANDLGGAFDISPKRQKEIQILMDEMVERFAGDAVRTCNVLDEIASFCNSWEECIWATVLHIGWHAKNGRAITF